MSKSIRQPVVVVLGHVDSGKTSLLDKIRGTAVQIREVGGITQHIGASFFPTETLSKICGPLLAKVGGEVRVPGLLVIDTPGHEVFANLRMRGGSAADISILVVDAIKGFEIQTYESLDILRRRKVPFVIALNKIDRVPGWRRGTTQFLADSLKVQEKSVLDDLDSRIYTAVGALSRLGMNSEAFFRVKDFTREIAIVPVSAKTGEGIPELITVLIGLTQQYLRDRLAITLGEPKGIILEVREEFGLGPSANVILLDGVLKVGHSVVMSRREGGFLSHVKAIFMPKPLDEMRDPRDKFTEVKEVVAAAGVKIVTPDLEGVLAGSPIIGIGGPSEAEEAIRSVEREVQSVFVNTDRVGVVVKADTLGSLEAIIELLRQKEVPVRIGDIGPVTRREVIEASTVRDSDPLVGVILSFGVKTLPDASEEISSRSLKVFADPIVYNLIESYLGWVSSEKEAIESKEVLAMTPPCKFRILKGLVFRRSNPAIFGVEVVSGKLRQKAVVMNLEGKDVGSVHEIQDKGKSISEAQTGSQVAVSMTEPVVGRQIDEGEILYAVPSDKEAKILREKYLHRLSEDERDTLNEIIETRRKVFPLYGF